MEHNSRLAAGSGGAGSGGTVLAVEKKDAGKDAGTVLLSHSAVSYERTREGRGDVSTVS